MIPILNILNFFSICLSVIFQILLIRSFGANLQTDAYFLTIGITQFVNAIFLGFTTDLFIPVYHEVKAKGKEEALRFTGAIFLFILVIGSILSVIAFKMAPVIVKIFATGFTADKVLFTANLIKILSITIIFSALNGLMIASLNANLFLRITYVAALITPALNNIVLIFYAKTFGVRALAYSIVIGSVLNFFLLFFYHYSKIGWRFSNPWKNNDIHYLLKKNSIIRSASFINSLKGPLTTNVLSYFPVGYFTLFSYADKILNILFRVTNSPMLNIILIKASGYLAMNKLGEIKTVLKDTVKSNFMMLICVLLPAILLFKKIFGVVFASKISSDEINIMYSIFLFLITFYLILSLEMPFTNVTIAMKEGFKIVKINIVSLILFILALLLGINTLKIYAIPIAMSFAQLYNIFVYTSLVNSRINFFDRDFAKMYVQFGILGVLIVILNMTFSNNFVFQIYSNIILMSLWSCYAGKNIIAAFRFVMRRGEIK
jgi:putative peptidoglycan lipid II flippase